MDGWIIFWKEIDNIDETHGLIITTFREFWSYHRGNEWIRLSFKLQPLSDNQTRIYINVSALITSKFRNVNRVIRERNLNEYESGNFCKQIFSYLENYMNHQLIEINS